MSLAFESLVLRLIKGVVQPVCEPHGRAANKELPA